MSRAEVDPERVALVLADAMMLGDKAAARKWSVCTRTLRRYRAISRTTPAIAASVQAKNVEVQHDLATLRVAFLREALQTMREKMKDATLYEVAGAAKIVGELHHVAMAVSEDERPDAPDPEAAEAEGGAPGATAH